MKTLLPLLVASLVTVTLFGADKPRITSQDQLPRYSYPLTGPVTDVVTGDAGYDRLAPAVRANLEKLLADYDIADRATLQDVLLTLMAMDVHEGKYAAARERLATVRALEEKPAAKLTTGLLAESYMDARASGDFASEEAFRAAFAKLYAQRLGQLPWDTVADNLKSAKASAEIASAALIVGNLGSQLQPGVDKTGTVSGEVAATLIAQRTNVAHYLPLKAERVAALTTIVNANKKEKANIWPARDISLTADSGLQPVVVAIWDSGVDTAVLPQQVWTNTAETANGADDDGNGYVDDLHGIAYNLKSDAVPEILVPLTPEQLAIYPQARNWTKGYLDLQASVDSPEASALKGHLSTLQPADVKPFIEGLNLFGNYTHGTHVAGIAAAGNPAIRLMAARITFDHRMIPDVPTREQAEKDAAAIRAVVAYLKAHQVRVVNMSWGGSPRAIEADFEANGAGGTPEERKATAREYFGLFKTAMTEAMAAAPEILFVAAAGNSDSDAAFDEFAPSGIDLPNILTVGAVDQAGEETSFSSFGKNVDVHANGFEVESYLPGGERMKYSGTSMASPNVANLAAKLIALDPALTVEQVTGLIQLGAERSADGRINLINPKRSFALLQALRQK
ncbi:Subtilisin [Lacunisphaera limnophila]|uniref:Subtilisin n=1 Tax=Lacunisphaera limnophila TaxID=1838286 RepID=A0A1D8AUW3_9BACT|nr:S8 family serine peptidase [Lacunisphaera limnophila]AOS44671.1 Subtilisin [Lacunisphaera limnophila]